MTPSKRPLVQRNLALQVLGVTLGVVAACGVTSLPMLWGLWVPLLVACPVVVWWGRLNRWEIDAIGVRRYGVIGDLLFEATWSEVTRYGPTPNASRSEDFIHGLFPGAWLLETSTASARIRPADSRQVHEAVLRGISPGALVADRRTYKLDRPIQHRRMKTWNSAGLSIAVSTFPMFAMVLVGLAFTLVLRSNLDELVWASMYPTITLMAIYYARRIARCRATFAVSKDGLYRGGEGTAQHLAWSEIFLVETVGESVRLHGPTGVIELGIGKESELLPDILASLPPETPFVGPSPLPQR